MVARRTHAAWLAPLVAVLLGVLEESKHDPVGLTLTPLA